jgi:hypothetical protein
MSTFSTSDGDAAPKPTAGGKEAGKSHEHYSKRVKETKQQNRQDRKSRNDTKNKRAVEAWAAGKVAHTKKRNAEPDES